MKQIDSLMLRAVVIIILVVLAHLNPYAQCCVAGNPVGGESGSQNISPRELIVALDYRFSLSKNYFYHDVKQSSNYVEKSFYNFSKLHLAYGLNDRTILEAEMGYFFNKTQDLNLDDGATSIHAKGIGDLGLKANMNLLKYIAFNPNKLMVSVGTIIPIGAFSEVMDNVTIPISLQPSSGAAKFNTGVYFSHKSKNRAFGWAGRFFFEYSNWIEKDFLIYKYGEVYLFETSLLYSKSETFAFTLSGKLEYRTKDMREDDIWVASSGGYFTSISPAFTIKLPRSFGVIASAEIPLYKYVNGYQLTNLIAFRIGLSKRIALKKENNPIY